MIGGCVTRSRPAGGCARVRSSIIIDGPSIWPAGKPAAAAPDCFAGRAVARRIGAAAERFGELPVAGDGAGALALARHHQGVDRGGGDRRVGIAAGAAHHFVQALALAHRRQLLDLAREQAGRRAAVGRRRRQRAHQHLELQVAQRAAARRGRQRRHQPLGGGQRRAVPGVGRHAAGAGPSGSRSACRRNSRPGPKAATPRRGPAAPRRAG